MRMTFRYLAVFLLGVLLISGNSQAVPMEGLYDAVVAVPDTSETERPAAFARALEKVLVRASGSPQVLQREGISNVLANAGSLVQAYRYQRAGPNNEALELAVSFGAVAVTRALAGIGAPVWGANRPAILGWIATQSRSGRSLATENEEGGWSALADEAARDKGIPLVLPDYDQEDQAVVSLSDIWGLFMDPIEKASEPYRYDLLGVARIAQNSGSYSARWALKGRGLSLDGQVQGETPDAVVDAVMAAWAEALAARYAVAPGGDQTLQVVDVVISAVENLEAYAQIRQFLAAMEPVSDAAPVRVVGGTLRIRVSFNGELDLLREHLALDRRLIPQQVGGEDSAPAEVDDLDDQETTATQQVTNTGMGPGADGQAEEGDVAPLDPSIQPIPSPGEPVALLEDELLSERAMQEDEEEDFKSLYPVLYFKWAGTSAREESLGLQQENAGR